MRTVMRSVIYFTSGCKRKVRWTRMFVLIYCNFTWPRHNMIIRRLN